LTMYKPLMRSFPWVGERFFKESGHGLGAIILRSFLLLYNQWAMSLVGTARLLTPLKFGTCHGRLMQ
jgi:hypothetical protein